MNATTPLELLAIEHARPLERFERANRAFFAARVGDRGEEFFEHFDDCLASRALENREGTSLYFVLVDANGEVLGRINISDIHRPDRTELGFRVAENAQGRGLATAGVTDALEIAAARGVRTVKARASIANFASRRVLERCGFAQTGQAEAPSGSSHAFIGYTKHLDGGLSQSTSGSRAVSSESDAPLGTGLVHGEIDAVVRLDVSMTDHTDETMVVSASRTIGAPPETIFELIAEPAQQPRWDGNDNLAEAAPGQRVRAVGDVFEMVLSGDGKVRENHVVEFEEGRLIAWRPSEVGKRPPGHLWRWQLEPAADGTTRVTHTYDWTRLTDETRIPRARRTGAEQLQASLDRLARLAEGPGD